MNASKVTTVEELPSNQEDLVNKVIRHSTYAIKTTEGSIILKYLSGETDIMIIAINLFDSSIRGLIDYGNGKNRKGVWFNSVDLDDNIRAVLIVFHAFTRNGCFVSFFFFFLKRDKQACFKVIKQCDKSISAFTLIGEDWELNAEHIKSCIGKFCISFVQIQTYRYQQSPKENV